MNNDNFKSERISKTATISLPGNVKDIFPLFGAIEEKKWAEGWNPSLIYPNTEMIHEEFYPSTKIMAEGLTFKTLGHGHDETEFLWIVTKFDIANHVVQYLVSSPNRYWTVTIECTQKATLHNTTIAQITYSYTGLNELGNTINTTALQKMYAENLKDWEKAISHYLSTGELLKH